MRDRKLVYVTLASGLFLCTFGCSKKGTQPPPVVVPKKTAKLEAKKIAGTADPAGVSNPTSAFWNSDYIEFTATPDSGSTGKTYDTSPASGCQYNLANQAPGFAPLVRMKAAYNDSFLYLWAQWSDTTFDRNFRRLYFDGRDSLFTGGIPAFPVDITQRDSLSYSPVPDSTEWTLQLNDDKIAVMWDITDAAGNGGANSPGGRFAARGCAITCHGAGKMYPDSGRTDLWVWNTSRGNPFGYVTDQYTDSIFLPAGIKDDDQEKFENENWLVTARCPRPRYIFDATKAGLVPYDERYYLSATDAVAAPQLSDIEIGNTYYYRRNSFDGRSCGAFDCHRSDGRGDPLRTIPDLSVIGRTLSDSLIREGLGLGSSIQIHRNYTNGIAPGVPDSTLAKRLTARIRAYTGAPGYYFTPPAQPAGLPAVLNVNKNAVYDAANRRYTVIIKRPLRTYGATTLQDVQFVTTREFPFSVALMDSDGKNHAGSPLQVLKFLPMVTAELFASH